MEPWKTEALKRFPEFADQVTDWETPYLLWFDVWDAFREAYMSSPRDEQMIARIYKFSEWCVDQPQGATSRDDLTTCVAVCFYEHIPELPEALQDMPRWFSREDVIGMKEIFSYRRRGGFSSDIRGLRSLGAKGLENSAGENAASLLSW